MTEEQVSYPACCAKVPEAVEEQEECYRRVNKDTIRAALLAKRLERETDGG